jgi:hypothetical protein
MSEKLTQSNFDTPTNTLKIYVRKVNSIKLSHTYKYIKIIMSEKLIQSNFHTPTNTLKNLCQKS